MKTFIFRNNKPNGSATRAALVGANVTATNSSDSTNGHEEEALEAPPTCSVTIKSDGSTPFSVKDSRLYLWDNSKKNASYVQVVGKAANVKTSITFLCQAPTDHPIDSNAMLALCIEGDDAHSFDVAVKAIESDGRAFQYASTNVPNPQMAFRAILHSALVADSSVHAGKEKNLFDPLVKDIYVVLCLGMPGCYRSTTNLEEVETWHGLSDGAGCAMLSQSELQTQFDLLLTDSVDNTPTINPQIKSKLQENENALLKALWDNNPDPPIELKEWFKNLSDDANLDAEEALEFASTECTLAMTTWIVDFILLIIGLVGVKTSIMNNIRTNFALNLERHLASETNGLLTQLRELRGAQGILKQAWKLFSFLGACWNVGCFKILVKEVFSSISLWDAIQISTICLAQIFLWAGSDGTLLVAELIILEGTVEEFVKQSIVVCDACI